MTREIFVDTSQAEDQYQNDSEESVKQYIYKGAFIIKLVSLASIGGFLFGYDTGIIAGAQLYFTDDWQDISILQQELIVSLAQLGAFIGALIAGPISDKMGRKPIIIISDIFFTSGAAIMAFSWSIPSLMVGRVITGLGIGIASMIVPVYISEICPKELRGQVVTFNALMITFAQFISSIICLLCGRNWRLMLGLSAIPSLIQLIGMFGMPESQRWLATKRQSEKMKNVIKKIYHSTEVEHQAKILELEMEQMRDQIEMKECNKIYQLFTVYKKCIFIGCMLQLFQQTVGINTIMYYGPSIILDSGIRISGYKKDDPIVGVMLNIPLAFMNALGSVVAIFYIDKLGRRYIFLKLLPLITLSLICVSISMWLSNYHNEHSTEHHIGSYLAIVFVLAYLAFFSVSMSGTVWSVNTEIYPIQLIGTANSLATATNWLSNFLISSLFLTITESQAGKVYAYLILATFSVMAWLFIYFLLPETKGKSIQDNVKAILGSKYKESYNYKVFDELNTTNTT